MRRHPHVHISAVSLGAVIALMGTFLPWVRSGAVDRSSYELFDIADRLGFSPDGALGWALRLWPLVPLLLTASAVSWWWPRARQPLQVARTVVALASVTYAGTVAVAVPRAPQIRLFEVGAGPTVTLVGVVVVVAGLAWALLVHRPDPAAGVVTPR